MTRLILYNLQYLSGGRGRKWEYLLFWRRFFHPREIKEKIIKSLLKYNPEVLAFVEVDTRSFNEHESYLDYFKKKFNMGHSIEKRKYHFVGLCKLLKAVPFLRNTSNAILSKKKLCNIGFFYFKHGIKRAIIKTLINVPRKVTLILVHLSLGKKMRGKQIEELIQIIKKIKGPLILMGDFNTYGGVGELKTFLKKTNLRFGSKNSNKPTFPSYRPTEKLDYVLISPEIKIKKYKILKSKFSDHLPVLVDFDVS